MLTRNKAYLKHTPFEHDTNLGQFDSRHCVAIVAKGTWTFNRDWNLVDTLCTELLDTGKWVQPHLHHTFLVLRGWGSAVPFDQDIKLHPIPKYSVTFDRIIPVKTGITLCGIPSIDINAVRDDIRTNYYVDENCKLDIAHATLLRAKHAVSQQETDKIVHMCENIAHGEFARLDIESFDFVVADRLLHTFARV